MPPTASEPTDAPVALAAMLERREARVARQRTLADRHGLPVVTLTLVFPGPVKNCADARSVFAAALEAIRRMLDGAGHAIEAAEESLLATGPEGMFVVDADPLELKRALVGLEERHPLGRLWDLDVVTREGYGVGRAQLGLPPRRCLVCAEPAHACARARRHPLAELQRVIAGKIDAYRRCPTY
jgi:holo-ACP synthase